MNKGENVNKNGKNIVSDLVTRIKFDKITMHDFNEYMKVIIPIISDMDDTYLAGYFAKTLVFKEIEEENSNEKDYKTYVANMKKLNDFITSFNIKNMQHSFDNGNLDDMFTFITNELTNSEITFDKYDLYNYIITFMQNINGFDFIKYAEILYNAKVYIFSNNEKKHYEIMQRKLKESIKVYKNKGTIKK